MAASASEPRVKFETFCKGAGPARVVPRQRLEPASLVLIELWHWSWSNRLWIFWSKTVAKSSYKEQRAKLKRKFKTKGSNHKGPDQNLENHDPGANFAFFRTTFPGKPKSCGRYVMSTWGRRSPPPPPSQSLPALLFRCHLGASAGRSCGPVHPVPAGGCHMSRPLYPGSLHSHETLWL